MLPEVMVMEDERAKLYLHAQAYGVDLESAGVIQFTGTVVFRAKEASRSIADLVPLARSEPARSELEKRVEIPYRMEVVDEALRPDVEERLVYGDQRDYITPLRLEVWERAEDYFHHRPAKFSGFADGAKLDQLGLYDTKRQFIRIYTDGEVVLPGSKGKKAVAEAGGSKEGSPGGSGGSSLENSHGRPFGEPHGGSSEDVPSSTPEPRGI